MTIESIIFDFDGVIADSTNIKTEAFVALYSKFPEKTQSEIKNYHLKYSGISRYKKLKYFQKEIIHEDYSKKAIDGLASEFSKIVLEKIINCKYIAGAKDFIENNYKHIDLFIATGTPQEEIEVITKEKNIAHLFKSIYGTPLTKTEIVKKILDLNKYNKRNIVMIGDAIADLEGAVNNNVKFIGRVQEGEESIFSENETIINDLTELDSLLLKL